MRYFSSVRLSRALMSARIGCGLRFPFAAEPFPRSGYSPRRSYSGVGAPAGVAEDPANVSFETCYSFLSAMDEATAPPLPFAVRLTMCISLLRFTHSLLLIRSFDSAIGKLKVNYFTSVPEGTDSSPSPRPPPSTAGRRISRNSALSRE